MKTVFLALGSNLNSPFIQITKALQALQALPKTDYIKCARFYRTTPLGNKKQSDYLNTVVMLTTLLSPQDLLSHTQVIELQQGRTRCAHDRWAARSLDIDILLYENLILSTPSLTIPHYDLHNRGFVLFPLYELEPGLVFPNGIALQNLIDELPKEGLPEW